VKLHYDEYGAGEALILVHGLGGTGRVWRGMMQENMCVYRAVCPDLRGAGRSESGGEFSTPSFVADLLELADELDITRCHWVGHSYGSAILQALAVDHPERVISLTMIGPIASPSETMKTSLEHRAAIARAQGLAEIASATARMGISATTSKDRPEIATRVREMVLEQDPRSYALTCEAITRTVAAEIETLRCPTLVLTGDEDQTASPQVGRTIAEKIPDAEFHLLRHCGHWAPVERAYEVAGRLVEFLARSSVKTEAQGKLW
jgi:3-oxoadipate enol-lactonase